MAQAEFDTVEAEHFAVERAGERKLLAERRGRCTLAGGEIARQVTGKPRLSLRAAPDHHGVGAGRRKRRVGIVKTFDVAVDDDRDGDCVLDRADRRPIGAALVELAAGAAMHRNEPHAGVLPRAAPARARYAKHHPSRAAS